MVTKTTLSALRGLLFLARSERDVFVSPRRIAEQLGESPTYFAKVTRLLARDGILRAEKGVKGGVRLNRPPSQITLLAVVEACQGTVIGSYCGQACDKHAICSFHHAALELHDAMVGVLSRWNLEQLLAKPTGPRSKEFGSACAMLGSGKGPSRPGPRN